MQGHSATIWLFVGLVTACGGGKAGDRDGGGHPDTAAADSADLGAPPVDVVASDLAAEVAGPPADARAADTAEVASPVERDEQGFEIDPPGRYYRGDLHVHATGASKGCGEQSYPADIRRVALERGLDFVVLTDHSYADREDPDAAEDPATYNTGPEFPYWDEAAALSEAGSFLMIDGAEICPIAEGAAPVERRGHIGCLPQDLATFDRAGAFTDRPPGAVTGGQALAQARARGCFAIIDHAYDLLLPIAYDWTSMDYDALEIWYGTMGYDVSDQRAYDAWRCDLLSGKATAGLGGAACHDVDEEPPGNLLKTALGYPTTSVFAAEFTWPALIEGMRAGQVSIHEGESFLTLDGYDADKRRATGAAIRFLRLRGRLDPQAAAAPLVLRRATACDDPRPLPDPPTVTEESTDIATVDPGAAFDHVVPLDGAAGVYTATLLPANRHYGALSRALVIAPAAE